MKDKDNKLMTKHDVAEILSTSKRTVERLVASKKLPKISIRGSVRFRLSDVIKLVEEGC